MILRIESYDADEHHNRIQRQGGQTMKGGYEALTWINDADGKQYVCALENIGNKKSFDDLTDEERSHCADVNQLVGTERW
jgi:hypothetical protein